jgi:hypothetical protein
MITKAPVHSFLSRLMAKTSADAADVFRYLFDGRDDEDDADDRHLILDDEDDNFSSVSSTFGNYWWKTVNDGGDDEQDNEAPAPLPTASSPVRKKTRTVYGRKAQADSTWSRDYLMPALRETYLMHPHGRDAKKFRRLFQVPYDLFVVLVRTSKERWWPEWTPDKVDAAGKLVSSLELNILGTLYVLGTGATQHQVCV